MDKKLCVVRVSKEVNYMVAAFKNGVLFVASSRSHKVGQKAANEKLHSELQLNRRKGYTLSIDEPFKYFCEGVSRNSLEQIDSNQKPKIVNALNAYYHLINKGLIKYKDGIKKVTISNNIVEKEINNGVETYLIDWESISEKELTLLLVCYSALYSPNNEINRLKETMSRFRFNIRTRKPSPRGIAL